MSDGFSTCGESHLLPRLPVSVRLVRSSDRQTCTDETETKSLSDPLGGDVRLGRPVEEDSSAMCWERRPSGGHRSCETAPSERQHSGHAHLGTRRRARTPTPLGPLASPARSDERANSRPRAYPSPPALQGTHSQDGPEMSRPTPYRTARPAPRQPAIGGSRRGGGAYCLGEGKPARLLPSSQSLVRFLHLRRGVSGRHCPRGIPRGEIADPPRGPECSCAECDRSPSARRSWRIQLRGDSGHACQGT